MQAREKRRRARQGVFYVGLTLMMFASITLPIVANYTRRSVEIANMKRTAETLYRSRADYWVVAGFWADFLALIFVGFGGDGPGLRPCRRLSDPDLDRNVVLIQERLDRIITDVITIESRSTSASNGTKQRTLPTSVSTASGSNRQSRSSTIPCMSRWSNGSKTARSAGRPSG
jgi:hypothetical protein